MLYGVGCGMFRHCPFASEIFYNGVCFKGLHVKLHHILLLSVNSNRCFCDHDSEKLIFLQDVSHEQKALTSQKHTPTTPITPASPAETTISASKPSPLMVENIKQSTEKTPVSRLDELEMELELDLENIKLDENVDDSVRRLWTAMIITASNLSGW